MATPEELQRQVASFVRAFGLHQPERTACGQPMSTSEAHALDVLSERGPMRLTTLATELLLEKSTVSRLVASMTARGWVRSQEDSTDRRARLLRLTSAGGRAAARVAAARKEHFASVLAAIPRERRDHVIEVLEELGRASRSLKEGGSHAQTG
ncbi:MAG: MarR family winged helix-turn-helix transcriptional regulator [Actinomycetota bacterium]|nr:MarR family winged helix-turn-helix transcriptional regulator [Actinomycetota bacterium]